jgi:hypothetical protein
MATHSLIGNLNPNGSVSFIWCKHDGGLHRVGKHLAQCYDTPDKLAALMKLGDLLALGPDIGTKHPKPPSGVASGKFEKWQEDYGALTTAMHRDVGYALKAPRVSRNVEAFLAAHESQEHAYLLDPEEGWLYCNDKKNLAPLSAALLDAEVEMDEAPAPRF